MVVSVQDICEQILKQVKISNLNFVIAETPFSLDIQIKKKFVSRFSEPAETSKQSSGIPNFRIQNSSSKSMRNPTNTLLAETLLTSSLPTLAMENMNTMPFKLPSSIPRNPTNTLHINPNTKPMNPPSKQSSTYPTSLHMSPTTSNQQMNFYNATLPMNFSSTLPMDLPSTLPMDLTSNLIFPKTFDNNTNEVNHLDRKKRKKLRQQEQKKALARESKETDDDNFENETISAVEIPFETDLLDSDIGIARETNNNIKGFEEATAHDDDRSDDLPKFQSLTATTMNHTLLKLDSMATSVTNSIEPRTHKVEQDEPASIPHCDLRTLLHNLSSELNESFLDIKNILVEGRQDQEILKY